jgi:hypothetical protein
VLLLSKDQDDFFSTLATDIKGARQHAGTMCTT